MMLTTKPWLGAFYRYSRSGLCGICDPVLNVERSAASALATQGKAR